MFPCYRLKVQFSLSDDKTMIKGKGRAPVPFTSAQGYVETERMKARFMRFARKLVTESIEDRPGQIYIELRMIQDMTESMLSLARECLADEFQRLYRDDYETEQDYIDEVETQAQRIVSELHETPLEREHRETKERLASIERRMEHNM